jgi:aspartate aminotransferase
MTRVSYEPPRLSAMQERVNFASAHPDRAWINFAENVPEHSTPPHRLRGDWSTASRYEDSTGNLSLREALVSRLWEGGVASTPDNFVIAPGGMGALNLIARELRRRGTRTVYCQTPLFHSVGDCFIAADIDVRPLRLDGVCESFGPGDSVYVNSPHNPTGRVLTPDEYTRLLTLVNEVGGALIVDSVYDDFQSDAVDTVSAEVSALAIQSSSMLKIGSMSKNYGLPGLRVGWIVGHSSWAPFLAARLEWEMVSVPGPNQLLAAELVSSPDSILQERVRGGRDFVMRWIALNGQSARIDVEFQPAGGTQIWAKTDLKDTEVFADYAFHRHNLLLTTYANYWWANPTFLRLPVGHSRSQLEAGLDALAVALTHFRESQPVEAIECGLRWDAR